MTIFREFETRELDLTRSQAESLQRTGFVEVSPGLKDRWRVSATSYVGTLVIDGVKLLIRPKIDPLNLFLLLEPGLPALAWQREAFEYDASSDLLASMVAFFARTLETTLATGLVRSYRTVTESRIAMRGRLDLAAQTRTPGIMSPVACTYDDFTENVLENQVLRAAVRRASRVPGIKPHDRQHLLRHLVALDSVADVPVTRETFDEIHITRLNQHYLPALRLAHLLISNLSLADAFGSTSASSFMLDMNDLFQRFVSERLRRELRHKFEVIEEPPVYLGAGRRVSMRPDLVFRDLISGQLAFVGDIKYKVSRDGTGRSNDYYQLLAYTTALDLPTGILIYCKDAKSEVDKSTVVVRNSGKNLIARAIDLAGPPSSVEGEISTLADLILESARTRAEIRR